MGCTNSKDQDMALDRRRSYNPRRFRVPDRKRAWNNSGANSLHEGEGEGENPDDDFDQNEEEQSSFQQHDDDDDDEGGARRSGTLPDLDLEDGFATPQEALKSPSTNQPISLAALKDGLLLANHASSQSPMSYEHPQHNNNPDGNSTSPAAVAGGGNRQEERVDGKHEESKNTQQQRPNAAGSVVNPSVWARMIVLHAEGDQQIVQDYYAQRVGSLNAFSPNQSGVYSPTNQSRATSPKPEGGGYPNLVSYTIGGENTYQPSNSAANSAAPSSARAEIEGGGGPEYFAGGENASVAPSLFSAGDRSDAMTEETLRRRALRIEMSLERRHSEGRLAIEPSAISLQLKRKTLVAKARFVHGITSDAHQFQKIIDHESKRAAKQTAEQRLRIDTWLDIVIEEMLEIPQAPQGGTGSDTNKPTNSQSADDLADSRSETGMSQVASQPGGYDRKTVKSSYTVDRDLESLDAPSTVVATKTRTEQSQLQTSGNPGTAMTPPVPAHFPPSAPVASGNSGLRSPTQGSRRSSTTSGRVSQVLVPPVPTTATTMTIEPPSFFSGSASNNNNNNNLGGGSRHSSPRNSYHQLPNVLRHPAAANGLSEIHVITLKVRDYTIRLTTAGLSSPDWVPPPPLGNHLMLDSTSSQSAAGLSGSFAALVVGLDRASIGSGQGGRISKHNNLDAGSNRSKGQPPRLSPSSSRPPHGGGGFPGGGGGGKRGGKHEMDEVDQLIFGVGGK